MSFTTRTAPYLWPADVGESEIVMVDRLGRTQYVRYLGPTPPTQAELDAQVAPVESSLFAQIKESSKETFDKRDGIGVLHRSEIKLLVRENNQLRSWITAFKAAVAGAGTFAAFKAAVAALPSLPDRTKEQVRLALFGDIDGEA